MELGMVGLGRMGGNMARRLLRDRHRVVVWNRTPDKVAALAAEGAVGAATLEELVKQIAPPRAVWLMIPASSVEEMIRTLVPLLQKGDLVVDGANSNFHDSARRGRELADRGIRFVDAGTSGGIWGLENGYCMMVGGDQEAVGLIKPALQSLAPPDGYLHVGPAGAGHFVKMVHNGIEYGMLQAIGEGFELLRASDFPLDLGKIARLWNRGSVVRSWLLELAERAFAKDRDLARVRGFVEDSGEGRWTVLEAIDKNIPTPVLTLSLMARFASRQDESFSAKVIAALRNEFGGHEVKKAAPVGKK